MLTTLPTTDCPATHRALGRHFTDREVLQVVAMVPAVGVVDARRLTPNVRAWGLAAGLLAVRDGRLHRTTALHLEDLPRAALWALVGPMVPADGAGRSVASDRRWLGLNIRPVGHRHHTDRDLQGMERVLCTLDAWGFLIFQSAGATWCVTRLS